MVKPTFYNERICLNVLAKDIHNAKDIYEGTEGHVLIGMLSSQFTSITEAVEQIKAYNHATNNSISLGLGAGDPAQWKMVASICNQIQTAHINQVFPAVGYTRALAQHDSVFINGLVKPTGKIGFVNIATGPDSSKGNDVMVRVEDAITIIREMGGNALKFFPMNGLETKGEFKAVARACAIMDFALEPTGGIDLNNFEEIMTIALHAGVKQIIPHIYSSIISTSTGETRQADVEKLYRIIKKVG